MFNIHARAEINVCACVRCVVDSVSYQLSAVGWSVGGWPQRFFMAMQIVVYAFAFADGLDYPFALHSSAQTLAQRTN